MNLYPYVIEIVQVLILLAVAPAFVGWVRVLKCWSQSRSSAGIFQPYRDIRKLVTKDVVLAENPLVPGLHVDQTIGTSMRQQGDAGIPPFRRRAKRAVAPRMGLHVEDQVGTADVHDRA